MEGTDLRTYIPAWILARYRMGFSLKPVDRDDQLYPNTEKPG